MHVNLSAISVFDGEADEAFLAATQWQTPWLPTALVEIVCAYIPYDNVVGEGALPLLLASWVQSNGSALCAARGTAHLRASAWCAKQSTKIHGRVLKRHGIR